MSRSWQGPLRRSKSMALADGMPPEFHWWTAWVPIKAGLSMECGVYQGVISSRDQEYNKPTNRFACRAPLAQEHHFQAGQCVQNSRCDGPSWFCPMVWDPYVLSHQRIPCIWRWHFMWKASELSFHPCNILHDSRRGVSRGNKNVGCGTWKRRFFAFAVRITGKLLQIGGYMLRSIWQALNCLFIYVTFCVIATGASPGQTKNTKLSCRWQTARCWFVKLLRYSRTFCQNT